MLNPKLEPDHAQLEIVCCELFAVKLPPRPLKIAISQRIMTQHDTGMSFERINPATVVSNDTRTATRTQALPTANTRHGISH